MSSPYSHNAMAELAARGYIPRHIAIVMGCNESTARVPRVRSEGTLKFLTLVQKQRLYVLDKLLELKPTGAKWSSNDYYYVTILRFLKVPKEQIVAIYPAAPQKQLAQACHKIIPQISKFDYTCLGVTRDEWLAFVYGCYNILPYDKRQ